MNRSSFERFALFFLKKKNFVFWLSVMSILFCGSLLVSYLEIVKIYQLESRLVSLQNEANLTLKKRKIKDQFLNHHILPDPYYLGSKIESIQFLQPEISYLESISSHPAYKNRAKVQKNLQSLKENNQLQFSEDCIRPSSKIQETEELQLEPILLNFSDLENLLCLIEGIHIGEFHSVEKQPQLVIRNFHLRKTPFFENKELFLLKLQLLKREFFKQKTEPSS